jgi:glycosyltransferase involved in cell wall biosynthesis
MRIGLIIYGTLQYRSGGYLYDRMLVEHLTASGDQVFLFSLPWRSYPLHLLDNLFTNLVRSIRHTPLDVLLQDELNHPSLVVPNLRLKKVFKRPIISIVHHLRCMEPHAVRGRLLMRWIERAYLKTVDGFIFNSCNTRDTVAGLIGQSKRHLVATPGGDRLGRLADQQAIEDRCMRPGALKLLFIGNVVRRKNLDGLLAGLARVRRVPWHLTVVGRLDIDIPYTGLIKNRIKGLGFSDRVDLCGLVDDSKLRHYLQSSHLIAMPFTYEGFGIVYLEGMAFGLPALASRVGGAPEVVRHGQTGYLFDPDRVDQLAAVVEHLGGRRAELLRLSLAARRRFEAFPTWRQTTGAIRYFLETAL